MDGSIIPVCANTLQAEWHPVYFILIVVVFFLIPFIILLCLFVVISHRLTMDSESDSAVANQSLNNRHQVRRQVVLMLASVCITFFICLLPFRLMTLWILASTPEQVLNIGMEAYYIILFSCRLLLILNASINPILYNLISCKFRSAFCLIFHMSRGSSRVRQSSTEKSSAGETNLAIA